MAERAPEKREVAGSMPAPTTEDMQPNRIRAALRRHPILAAVVGAVVVGFGIYGVANGARLTVSYVVIVTVAALAVGVFDDRARFSRVALVGLAVWGVGHLAGGIVALDGDRILYNALLPGRIHFDNVVHFIGFGSAGLACWEGLRASASPRFSPRVAWFVVWIAAMGVGAANEVIEFAATHLLEATQVGGYQNTGRDLVANLLGGAVFGLWAARARAATP